jgi:ribosomal protein S21|tara:strand:- start:1121 stop:1402 length:282 start_codon:yes stop_codon:yes gene_type:complete
MRNRENDQKNKTSGFVTVNSKECGDNPERMIRKFIKKVKKEGIIDEVRERRYFKKQTTLRAEQKRNKKRLVQKINKQRDELFTTTKTRLKRRK